MTTNDMIGNVLAIGGLIIGGIVVTRVIKKQSLAAEIRKKDPSKTYHESIVDAFEQLGYDKPFNV